MSHSALVNYQSLVRLHKKQVACHHCSTPFKAKDLEKHLLDAHVRSRHCCPWCEGRYSWKPKQKSKHARHLSDCFKAYWKRFQWIPPAEPPQIPLFQSATASRPSYKNTYTSQSQSFVGRIKLVAFPSFLYELIFLPPLIRETDRLAWWVEEPLGNELRFIDCNDLAIRYIQKFIAFQGSAVGWFHLMVRADAFEIFYKAFSVYVDPGNESKRDRAFLLEYSCWCDGGERYTDPHQLHHRHMIAVARDGNDFLTKCWNKIHMPDPPFPNYRFKLCKKIDSWRHLKHALFYVSSIKASCDFLNIRCYLCS